MALTRLTKTLKKMLKSKKINYKQLASEIGMSESGVKKLLSAQDISLGRLTQVSEVIGIPLAEILQMVDEEEIKNIRLSPKQEEAFLKDNLLFRIFWLYTVEEKNSEQISRQEKISPEKIQKYMIKLENIDLIRMGKNKKYVPIHKGLYRWVNEGKLLDKLNRDWSESTLNKVLYDLKNKNNFHRLSYLKLSPGTQNLFYEDLNNLLHDYAKRSRREKIENPFSHLKPLSVLIAISATEFI